MKKLATLSIVLLYVAALNSAFAQVNAVLSGTVADASGALIPGVVVTAKTSILESSIPDSQTNRATLFFPASSRELTHCRLRFRDFRQPLITMWYWARGSRSV